VRDAGRKSNSHRGESRTRAAPLLASTGDLTIEAFRWRALAAALSQLWHAIETRPASVFILLSLAFGIGISLVVPPLRGPDEISHFLRIHAYARGALLPTAELDGRKGIFVSRDLYAELSFYKEAGERFFRERRQGLRYGTLMAEHRTPRPGLSDEDETAGLFMPFAGTEGYNPAAYIPYILGARLGDAIRLDFPTTLLIMRILGVIAFTAALAFAIRITPALKWAFVLIAMLPVALYNRSVLSADGAALASALVVTALCFSGTRRLRPVWERSLWMTLCALAKQPQIVFLLLEGLVGRKAWRHGGGSMALVIVPGLVLSPLWVMAVSADVAAWRLQVSEIHPPEQFDPLWKLAYMWEHPLHFPWAAWNAVMIQGGRLGEELIGILGWQDIVLDPGLVASLARPGGNVTGLTFFNPELAAKRFEMLKETLPGLTEVGLLLNPANPTNEPIVPMIKLTAQALGLEVYPFGVRSPAEFEGAFAAMATKRVGAVVIVDDATLIDNAPAVARRALQQRLPSSGWPDYAVAGGVIGYGVNFPDMFRRAATFVDKILKGTKPTDLPVERATKFETIVNLKTAKALGLDVPPMLLARADEVIE
jgi:hypothetical protein